jgi:hypothetical protein
MPGEATRCSASAAAGSNEGAASTESGGNVTITKHVPSGVGTWLRTEGVGSSSRAPDPPGVAHSIVDAIPGTCTNSCARGAGPSLTTTALPSSS